MTKKQKLTLCRIIITAILFLTLLILEHLEILDKTKNIFLVLLPYLAVYCLIGYDVIIKAAKNMIRGQVFDENFLMLIATVAAFFIGEYSEAVAVMLFYQVGELFQSYAVGKSRRSVTELMDIVPEYANIERDGKLIQVDPDEVEAGTVIVIKPGERVPLDGIITEGEATVNTSALTGESVPRVIREGEEIFSGFINGSTTVRVRTTKEFENSTVSRILELVENAAGKKAQTEKFITRFAKIYTPAVTALAVILAVIPPLLMGASAESFGLWIKRACIFLVISCPCALVISVPMGFFGGIGAASKAGVLVKGGNYLEALSELSAVAFDKTGTLTKGEFSVTEVKTNGCVKEVVLRLAAFAEWYSNHPIAVSIREEFLKIPHEEIDLSVISTTEELAGLGIHSVINYKDQYLGNAALMKRQGIEITEEEGAGTVVYLAEEGKLLGSITISDTVKAGVREAIGEIKDCGVNKCVMLTGDRANAAQAVADELGITEVHSELLPEDKVRSVEGLISAQRKSEKTAFVGDGINDAPVLSIADVGIAMGSMGSDAAIEAADVVIMDDDIKKIPKVIRIAKKTMRIVKENIAFALSVKLIVMILGVFGLADMWLAVFADVGVSVIAILNSMRTLKGIKNQA